MPRNSKRKGKPKSVTESSVAMIDRLLLNRIKVTQDGREEIITILAAIMRQLLQQEVKGNVRASAVLRKYKTLIRRKVDNRPQVVFADNEYSRSFDDLGPKRGDG